MIFHSFSGEIRKKKKQLVRLRCHWFTAFPVGLLRIGCQIHLSYISYKTMPSILHRNGNIGSAVIGLCDMSFSFDLFSPPQWYIDKCYDGYVIMPIGERCAQAHTKTANLWLTTLRVTGLRWLTIKTSSVPFDHSEEVACVRTRCGPISGNEFEWPNEVEKTEGKRFNDDS